MYNKRKVDKPLLLIKSAISEYLNGDIDGNSKKVIK